MSIMGNVEAKIREAVGGALAELGSKVAGTETRLDRVEERVSAVEDRLDALERKPARPAVKARAGVASGTGEGGSAG